jgi:UDP-GlcNAc:undecaprenyl-phosphate GlcNAc-1-phosphate transferase
MAGSFLVSVLTTLVFKRVAVSLRWLDAAGADALKIHDTPTPFIGGFGVFSGCAVSFGLAAFGIIEAPVGVVLLFVLGLSVFALGLRDDIARVPPIARLSFEVGVGAMLAVIGSATSLIELRWKFPTTPVTFAAFVVLVAVFVAGVINAVNMLDGMDGLAGGIGLISCAGFAVTASISGNHLARGLALALVGSLAAFLLFNFHPASVFMGDNGSYFLGFMLASIAVLLSAASGTIWGVVGSLLLIGVPIFDAGFAVVRRLRHGVSPFLGDRSHFYDYLSLRGLSTPKVAIIGYLIQICLVTFGSFLFLW